MKAKKDFEPRNVVRHLFAGPYGYYCRMGVPVALRPIVGKRELWAPCHAQTDAQAIRNAHAVVAGFHATLNAARAQAKPQRLAPRGRPLTPQQLALAQYSDSIRDDTTFRNADYRYAAVGFIDDDYVRRLRTIVSGAADNSEIRETLGVVLRYYEVRGHIKAAFGTPEWREAARALAVAELEGLARTAERDDGDFAGKPADPLLTEQPKPIEAKADPLAARMLSDDSSKPLSEIVPTYLKERGSSAQTQDDTKVAIRIFEECLEAKPLYQITRADVRSFMRTLQDTPLNHTKRFPGLSISEAIKANRGRAEPYPTLNPKTVNLKYLGKLRAVLEWCRNNDLIPDNPASGVRLDSVKGKTESPRLNFSPGDLSRIFSPERFDTSKPLDERQWAQIMALYTGTRAAELAQVKLDCVRHERGVLVIAIEGKLKNLGSRRLIPVHSDLIKLGFEKHVAKLRKAGQTHLFATWFNDAMATKKRAESRANVILNGYFARIVPRWFVRTVLPAVGISDSRLTWHSFRHTFASGLARAGIVRSVRGELMGQADASAHAGYVHDTSVEQLKAAIEAIKFDGFALAGDQSSPSPSMIASI